MRRLIAVLVAATTIIALLVSGMVMASYATDNLAAVGAMGSTIWKDFSQSDMNKVSRLIRAEFNRTSQLRSEMHKGGRYFDYGEATDELVHAWAGSAGEYNGVPHDPVGCMNQDFSGGYSTCLQAFEQPSQWCCILVTRASFEKNEAYTIRDAMASKYAAAGGPNSAWGMPTSNQYWVIEDGKEVLYQQFDNGYARAVDGSALDAFFSFHYKWDEETDMNYPKSGAPDRPSFNGEIDSESSFTTVDPDESINIPSMNPFSEPDDLSGDDNSGDSDNSLDTDDSDPATLNTSGDVIASGSGNINDSDITAENSDGTAPATSGNVRVVRHNSPFYQFVIDYWWVLVIAGVVVVAIVVTVTVTVIGKKKKAGAEADDTDHASDKKLAEDNAENTDGSSEK